MGCYEKSCGNGILNNDEDCDDGNILSGDGCSKQCKSEYSYICIQDSRLFKSVCSTASTKNSKSISIIKLSTPSVILLLNVILSLLV